MLRLRQDPRRRRAARRVRLRPALSGTLPLCAAARRQIAPRRPALDDVALPRVAAPRRRGVACDVGRGRDAAACSRARRRAARLRGSLGQRRERQSYRLLQGTGVGGGVALAACAAGGGVAAGVYAPASTPPVILTQIRSFGAELVLVEGHIGDCGKAARAYAADTGAMDVSTLREPYRIEGKKSLGLEVVEQLGWTLPDVIVYPTGGGTGLIGMWKAFGELAAAGWVRGPLPRMYSVQSAGCAPVVQAFRAGAEACTPWPEPRTIAAGLRVPSPLGDRLMLTALRQSGGDAVAVTDAQLVAAAEQLQTLEGVDASPEGGATLAAALELKARGVVKAEQRIVLFNTGAGWLYRDSAVNISPLRSHAHRHSRPGRRHLR